MSLVVLAEIVSSAFIWVPADTTMDGGVSVMATSLVPPCPNMPVEPWVESTNVPRLSNVARQPGGESRARSYVCGPLPSLVSCSDAPVGSKASMASTPWNSEFDVWERGNCQPQDQFARDLVFCVQPCDDYPVDSWFWGVRMSQCECHLLGLGCIQLDLRLGEGAVPWHYGSVGETNHA